MNKVILGLMLVSIMMLALFSVNQYQTLQQEEDLYPCEHACGAIYDACLATHTQEVEG